MSVEDVVPVVDGEGDEIVSGVVMFVDAGGGHGFSVAKSSLPDQFYKLIRMVQASYGWG